MKPELRDTELQQQPLLPTQDKMDTIYEWVVVIQREAFLKDPGALPYADVLWERRRQTGISEGTGDTASLLTELPNSIGSRVSYAFIDSNEPTYELLSLARQLASPSASGLSTKVSISVVGFDKNESERIAEVLLAGVYAANIEMPSFRKQEVKPTLISKIDLYGVYFDHNFLHIMAEAKGNGVARYLSMLPGNKLTPSIYLSYVKQLALENDWLLDFYDTKELEKLNAGAFLAVAQASPVEDAGIVRLRYTPESPQDGVLALVGKGVCYDTGGASLKSAKGMYGMHEDMQGSSVALGTFLALSEIGVPYCVECWLAIAVNDIGPKGYKPNDVITAVDGTHIEVVNTDAEGRLVLADTLALVSREKPSLIIDYATLTGAAIDAVGTTYSAAFTNRDHFHDLLIQSGRHSGERVWTFPLDKEFDHPLKSVVADIKNAVIEGEAKHILAARFLYHFVDDDIPWIHLDLSSSNRTGGLGHIPTDTTGFGVRFTLNLLRENDLV